MTSVQRPLQSPLAEYILGRGYETNQQFAIAMGTEPSTVSRWRNGLIPGLKMRKKIAKKLNLTPTELKRLGWEKEFANV